MTGVSGIRVYHGPGYRVCFKNRGKSLVIILAGGDKRTRKKIEKALRLARDLSEREKRISRTKTTRFETAEHRRAPEKMAAHLEACLEESNGDAAFVAKALGDIAKAKGMTQVARDAGQSREPVQGSVGQTYTPVRHPSESSTCPRDGASRGTTESLKSTGQQQHAAGKLLMLSVRPYEMRGAAWEL